jgi:serine phosphatase RsbU (regulator of sigma subunit)
MVTPHSARWFRLAVAAGFALGLLLLLDTIYTFRYVVRNLVFDHLGADAGQLVAGIEATARNAPPADPEALAAILEAVVAARPGEVAWVRVADQDGRVLAATGGTSGDPLPQAAIAPILAGREPQVRESRDTPRGEALVVTLPFRFQFPEERAARAEQRGSGQPRFKIAEAALYLDGASGVFWPLRRALVISLTAAAALLAAMTVLTLQFRRYVQARQIEQQLAVARVVQRELLPQASEVFGKLDFAVEFTPASEVGGDFYDLFRVPNGAVALVLGDVAGKGLPAAILMGVIHGVVRAASARWTGGNHAELAAYVNELLCSRTAGNRYVTLFWGSIDADGRTLRYVNAGHLPPLLFRRTAAGGVAVERLEEGGPVVGLMPGVPYRVGEARLEDGDLLVAFSDGLSEAANASDEEFGSERVIEAVASRVDRPPADVLTGILDSVRTFTAGEPPRDDLCVLVVRARTAGTGAPGEAPTQ